MGIYQIGKNQTIVDNKYLAQNMGQRYITRGTHLSGNDKCYRLNRRSCNFIRTRNLTFTDVESTTREETHSSLGTRGLILRERVQ